MNHTIIKIITFVLIAVLALSAPALVFAEETSAAQPQPPADLQQEELSRGTKKEETIAEESLQDGSAAKTKEPPEPEREASAGEEVQDPQAGDMAPVDTGTQESSSDAESVEAPADAGTEEVQETKQETTGDAEEPALEEAKEPSAGEAEEPAEEIREESEEPEASVEDAVETEETKAEDAEAVMPRMKLMAAPVLKAAGSVHTEKAVNSSAVEVVKLGSTADSAYAFSLRPNLATTIEPFGFKSGEVYKESDKRFTAYVSSDSQSGNCGFWIYNAGRYHGKAVDVKGTITYKSGETPTIFFGTSGASFGCWFQNYPYVIRYDLYTKENGKEVPLKVTMSATLLDIDYYQKFAIKANSGSIAKIQVTDTSEVWYGTNSAYPDWKYLFAGSDIDYPTTPIEEAVKAEARVLFRETGSFSVAYSSQQYESLFPGMGMDDNIVAWKWTDDAKEAVRNGEWYDGPKHYMAFSAVAFGPYDVPTPVKTVTDADETEVTSNTITDTETFHFDICQEVPYERDAAYYYSAFVMKDTVPTGLKVTSVKILNEAGGNATGKFNVTTSGQTVTATAIDPGASSFYNQEYTMQIFCKYDASAGNAGPWKNKASVEVTRGGKKTTNTSNETTTQIPFRKITTEVVNGTITPSDTKVKVGTDKKIDYSPKEGYFLTSVAVDGKEVEEAKYPSTYSFTNVQADHTIKVVYSPAPTKQVVDSKGSDINGKLVGQGSTIIYKINITNASDFAKTVTVTDSVPAGTAFVSADNGGTAKDSTVTWANISVPAKSTKTVSFTVKAAGEGVIRNTAKVRMAGVELATNEVANVIIPPPKKAVFDRDGKDIDHMDVEYGEELTYRITVKNTANVEKAFTVTDKVPEHTLIQSVSDGGMIENDVITWTLGLKGGEEKTVTFTALAAEKNVTITNAASQTVDGVTLPSNSVVNFVQPDPVKTVTKDGKDVNGGVFFRTEDNTALYTITWTNIADHEVEYELSDKVPAGMLVKEVSDGGKTSGSEVIWTGTAKAGEAVTRTITAVMPDESGENAYHNRADLISSRTKRTTNEVVTYLTDIPKKAVIDGDGTDMHGQVIRRMADYRYQITFHNPREEKTAFTVTDVIMDGISIIAADNGAKIDGQAITWNLEMEPDEEKMLTVIFKAPEEMAGSRIDNAAHVSAKQYEHDTNVVTTYVIVDPVKEVHDKDGKDIDRMLKASGDELTYVITVKNPADTKQEVKVTDKLPENVKFISADNGGECKDGTVTWKLVMAPEAELKLSVKVKVLPEAKGKILKNHANAAFKVTDKDTNEVKNPILPDPVKTVTDKDGKDIDGHPVQEGQILTYTITQENPADEEKTFTITDKVPAHTKWEKIHDSGKEENGVITWTVKIPAGKKASVRFTVKALEQGTVFRNTAAVTSDGTEQKTNTTVNAVPKDPVKKGTTGKDIDVNGKTISAGAQVTYDITVNNPFDFEKEFKVTDVLPEGTEFVSADNGGTHEGGTVTWSLKMKKSETRTIRVTVKVKEDVQNAKLVNRAIQSADSWKKETKEVVSYVPYRPKKEVLNEKGESYNEGIVKAGDILTYRITVYNPKDAQEADYVIRDYYPADKVEFIDATDGGKETTEDGGRHKVRFEVKVPAGEAKEVSFRVRVKETTEAIKNSAEAELKGHTVQTGEVVNYPLTAPEKYVYFNGKEWNKQEVFAGLLIEYRIKVHNPSEKEKTIKVTDTLDPNLEYVKSSYNGQCSGDTVTWNVTLAGGTDLYVTVTARVKAQTPSGTVVKNRAVMDAGGKEMETNEVENPIRKVDITVPMRAYNTVRTGDNGRMLAAGIIMAMAAAGIGAVLAVGRKKNV